MQIFRDAVNEILGGPDGVCAWAGSTLRTKALRLEMFRNRDEECPDYNDWLELNGLEHFDEQHANEDFGQWVSLFSMLIDGQSREAFGVWTNYSLKNSVKYRSNAQLNFKQAKDARFNDSEHKRLREEDALVWSAVQSAEETDVWPEGSYDLLKEKISKRRREVLIKHKESDHKIERMTTLDLALAEL